MSCSHKFKNSSVKIHCLLVITS